MGKISKEEIAARRKAMQEEALRSVAKTEQLNIRIDEQSIQRLYMIAGPLGKPVGTMVREWILDRLHSEESPRQQDSLVELKEMLADLHSKFDRLSSVAIEEQAESAGIDASLSVQANAEKAYLKLVS